MISSCNALAIHAELMMNLPISLSIYFFVRECQKPQAFRRLAFGFFVGCGSLFRHQAGIVLLAIMPVLIWNGYERRIGWRKILVQMVEMGAGFASLWLVCGFLYYQIGHLPEFRPFVFAG